MVPTAVVVPARSDASIVIDLRVLVRIDSQLAEQRDELSREYARALANLEVPTCGAAAAIDAATAGPRKVGPASRWRLRCISIGQDLAVGNPFLQAGAHRPPSRDRAKPEARVRGVRSARPPVDPVFPAACRIQRPIKARRDRGSRPARSRRSAQKYRVFRDGNDALGQGPAVPIAQGCPEVREPSAASGETDPMRLPAKSDSRVNSGGHGLPQKQRAPAPSQALIQETRAPPRLTELSSSPRREPASLTLKSHKQESALNHNAPHSGLPFLI